MAECVSCGDNFNPKRYRLGYRTCLECGQPLALQEKVSKSRRTAPAFNKGAYPVSYTHLRAHETS